MTARHVVRYESRDRSPGFGTATLTATAGVSAWTVPELLPLPRQKMNLLLWHGQLALAGLQGVFV